MFYEVTELSKRNSLLNVNSFYAGIIIYHTKSKLDINNFFLRP